MIKISCLIPTYNEEPRIKNVLSIVAAHPLVDEVLVIDDGSKDATQQIVEELAVTFPKIRLIVHKINQGKSMAISTGIRESKGAYLMFIDADLIGISADDLTNLVDPVITGQADVTISLRGNTPGIWKRIGLDYISGERVMPRDFLIEYSNKLPLLPRFGLESYLNKQIIKNKFKIRIVPWPNVSSPWKYKKQGYIKGVWGDAKMMMDIFRTITIFGPIYQIYKIKKLQVK